MAEPRRWKLSLKAQRAARQSSEAASWQPLARKAPLAHAERQRPPPAVLASTPAPTMKVESPSPPPPVPPLSAQAKLGSTLADALPASQTNARAASPAQAAAPAPAPAAAPRAAPPPEQPTIPANPFAAFTFGGEAPPAAPPTAAPLLSTSMPRKRRASASAPTNTASTRGLEPGDRDKRQKRAGAGRGGCKAVVEIEVCNDLPKWLSMVEPVDCDTTTAAGGAVAGRTVGDEDGDEDANVATAAAAAAAEPHGRFQILVAMLLHARCRETVVRAAMRKLRTRLASQGGICPAAIGSMEEGELGALLSSVHYNNAKAKYLQSSARMISSAFGGGVPKQRSQLLRLPGIGEKLAALLLIVFRELDRHAAGREEEAAAAQPGSGARSAPSLPRAPSERPAVASSTNRSDSNTISRELANINSAAAVPLSMHSGRFLIN